jgi:hypothetical protein
MSTLIGVYAIKLSRSHLRGLAPFPVFRTVAIRLVAEGARTYSFRDLLVWRFLTAVSLLKKLICLLFNLRQCSDQYTKHISSRDTCPAATRPSCVGL